MRVRILIPRRKPKKLVSRRRNKRSGQMTLIIVVTSVLGSLYALVGENGVLDVMKMRARAHQLELDIAARERENLQLSEIIKPLRDEEPDAIEKLAREKLFMTRPGDTLYTLPKELRPVAPQQTESSSPPAPSLLRRR